MKRALPVERKGYTKAAKGFVVKEMIGVGFVLNLFSLGVTGSFVSPGAPLLSGQDARVPWFVLRVFKWRSLQGEFIYVLGA